MIFCYVIQIFSNQQLCFYFVGTAESLIEEMGEVGICWTTRTFSDI